MTAWRYEISLLVLKKYFTRSLRSLVKYFSTLEEKFRISARPCNILYLICFSLISSGSVDAVRVLLEAGARVSAVNNIGRTAAQLGAFVGKKKKLSKLSL